MHWCTTEYEPRVRVALRVHSRILVCDDGLTLHCGSTSLHDHNDCLVGYDVFPSHPFPSSTSSAPHFPPTLCPSPTFDAEDGEIVDVEKGPWEPGWGEENIIIVKTWDDDMHIICSRGMSHGDQLDQPPLLGTEWGAISISTRDGITNSSNNVNAKSKLPRSGERQDVLTRYREQSHAVLVFSKADPRHSSTNCAPAGDKILHFICGLVVVRSSNVSDTNHDDASYIRNPL